MLRIAVVLLAATVTASGTDLPGQWGGAWGSRASGPRRLAKRSPDKLAPVLQAQRWLASIQRVDGAFPLRPTKKPGATVKTTAAGTVTWTETGSTSLALLSFLASGNTTDRGSHRAALRRGANWLCRQQIANGSFRGTGSASWSTLEHCWATTALAEIAYMAGDQRGSEPTLHRAAAEKALAHLARLRHPDGGWSRSPRAPFSSPLTTAWAIPTSQFASRLLHKDWQEDTATAWLTRTEDDKRGPAGDGSKALQRPTNADPKHRLAAAARLFARFSLGQDPRHETTMNPGAEFLLEQLDQIVSNDPQWRCMAAQALYQLSSADLQPRLWRRFESQVLTRWAAEQIRSGAGAGSWPGSSTSESGRSRTITTALNTLAQASRFRFTRLIR